MTRKHTVRTQGISGGKKTAAIVEAIVEARVSPSGTVVDIEQHDS